MSHPVTVCTKVFPYTNIVKEVTKAPEQKQKEEETLQLQDVFTEALRSQTCNFTFLLLQHLPLNFR